MNPKPTRRLSAIMFTDIVGYTSLMQYDETKAAEVRAIHREVFEKEHEVHQGNVLQYYGDGTLSVFQSGVRAVECAIAIQKQMQKSNVPIRIGLHIGDIVYDDTEVYGDSVNLAARIESMGVAGAILLSGRLNDELKNHPYLSTTFIGDFELKNVEKPLEVFAVDDIDLVIPHKSELKGKQAPKVDKTIAVLPFVNMSADPENEYFSDGMTEEIINALAKIKGLKVTSRTSSFHFKNKNIPIQQIGEALNVSTILEGSVRLAKNKMRITAQLIDVADDFHFWSETFDRSMDDIFEVQDEISLLIADKLREHIGHFEIAEHLVEVPDVSIDNYKLYLQSRFLILQMTKTGIEKGMSILEKIIEESPNYALAYLGMHLGYTLAGNMGYMSSQESFVKGRPYLDKAIELDDSLPECQMHLSYDAFIVDWDLKKAYGHLQKSFEIRPSVEYYQSMASFLSAELKLDAALNYIETGIQIDPFHFINYHLKGFIHYCKNEYGTAIPYFDKALEINPSFVPSVTYKGQALVLSDQPQAALKYYDDYLSEGDHYFIKLGGSTLVHAALKDSEKTKEGIQQLEDTMDTDMKEGAMTKLILCLAMNGQKEEALKLIEEGIAIRLSSLIYLITDPLLDSLRSSPKFEKMRRSVFGVEIEEKPPKRKYKKSLLDETELRKQRQRLQEVMVKDKPYLNPDLTLRDLADLLDLPPNYMSQLLNEGFDQNFSEFVNTYRLETYKTKIADPANKHLTILGIAYESGFNSKTVFNTFFKKVMGKTPKAYSKEINQ